jgi:D-sedoheptulose 7-phosphate isomerase
MMVIFEYLDKVSGLLKETEVTDKAGKSIGLVKGMELAVRQLSVTAENGGKVMALGNGGSACIASHIHNDLSMTEHVRSMVFYETSLLTALANDYGYNSVFQSPIGDWAEAKDVLIAISSSGCSENILSGVDKAIKKQCQIITFTGFEADNPLRKMGAINFYVKGNSFGHVEASHCVLTHYLTDAVKLIKKRIR